jgi:tetratricopeptide (TPR) repeat protein
MLQFLNREICIEVPIKRKNLTGRAGQSSAVRLLFDAGMITIPAMSPSMKLKLFALALILSMGTQSAQAKFAYPETVKVPVQRVLKNLESRTNKPGVSREDKAMQEFQIGRLHSMAYALKTEEASIRKPNPSSDSEGGSMEPFYGIGQRDYQQFPVTSITSGAAASANVHLQQAIAHLKNALKLDPSLIQAKLGLAWCLDQSGNKQAALPLYREVLNDGWNKEKSVDGLRGSSIVQETAGYLEKLLDPIKDANEIATIKNRAKDVNSRFRTVTPILVPLVPNINAQAMMRSANVLFDLDGNGAKHYSQWTGAQTGWLAYDADKSKQITSGLQLFGPSTFWIFWNDGYEAMRSLDDNNDGKLEGDELNGLAVWSDVNGDGKSDRSEVRTVQELGITSLSCVRTVSKDGTIYSTNGVTFTNGQKADTFDWNVPQLKPCR